MVQTPSLKPINLDSIKPNPGAIALKTPQKTIYGILIASIIISLWAGSLCLLLAIDLSKMSWPWVTLALLWQTFLYTGLFITAHDAMHGAVFPQNPKINHLIGSIAALAYGLFSYQELLKKHWLHHRFPASTRDPDFHDSRRKNFFAWYFYFMKNYWSWRRILGLILIFNFLTHVLHVPDVNLTLFWAISPILSSVQLFYFGTFLTHREPDEGYTSHHRTQSTAFPWFWSFITCYHFGYHYEHHEYPHVPWWQLPEVRNASQQHTRD